MTRRLGVIGFAALLLAVAARPADAQRQTTGSVEAIDRWVKKVNAHVPGRPDASVGAIISMPYEARRELNSVRFACDGSPVDGRLEVARHQVDSRLARGPSLG